MTDLVFAIATYGELVLLNKAWKMHDALITVVASTLIELASKRARYTGGKLAIGCHPDTCQISKSGTQRWTPETTRAAIVLLPLACD